MLEGSMPAKYQDSGEKEIQKTVFPKRYPEPEEKTHPQTDSIPDLSGQIYDQRQRNGGHQAPQFHEDDFQGTISGRMSSLLQRKLK